MLGNRKANELSRLLLLCPFLLLYLAMYIASYLPGGSGPHVLSRPDALGGESTFTSAMDAFFAVFDVAASESERHEVAKSW